MSNFSIHPNTRIGRLSLVVSDLDRSLRFYQDVLGFRLISREGSEALLGTLAGEPLLALTGHPGARPRPPRSTGLYHFAILLPTRQDLARWLKHMAQTGNPVEGAADHAVSEAVYLSDPDSIGIEIYADRPRQDWPRRDGQIQMGTDPLDLDNLLSTLTPEDAGWQGLPSGTRVGHVHLHVADLSQAVAFYADLLGLGLMQRYGPSAAFLSAGGYHHHVGVNTWAGVGAPPPPSDAAGLRYFTVEVPAQADLDRVAGRLEQSGIALDREGREVYLHDPSGNGIRLVALS